MQRAEHRWAAVLFLVLVLALPALATGPGGTERALAPPAPSAPGSTPGGPAALSAAALRAPAPSGSYALQWAQALILYNGYPQAGYIFGEGGTMTVDDALGRIMLFGGEGSAGLSDITLDYNVTNGTFDPLGGPAPSARTNASVALDPTADRAILFGGLTSLGSQSSANDTWLFWFSNESWQNVSRAVAPPARENAALAVDPATGEAVLEGGRTPAAHLGNSTALVLWNDTWALNLTTLNWSLVPATVAPPPGFAAGLGYDPVDHGLYLFGGCGFTCSARVWQFDPATGQWGGVASSGTPPAGRGASVWVWEANASDFLLFGGFQWNGSVPSALGDLYRWDPAGRAWSALSATGGPGPDYGPNAAWANFSGCIGLLLIGGSVAYSGPPGSGWVLEPYGVAQPDCFPNAFAGGGGPPPPPCSNSSATLTLRVQDSATRAPIVGASVTVQGRCGTKHLVTNASGAASLVFPSPDRVNVSASAAGYHSSYSLGLLGDSGGFIEVNLTALPSLHVLCLGANATVPSAPLDGVSVLVAGSRVVGLSGPSGWVNVSSVDLPGPSLTVSGSRAGYGDAARSLALAYTGTMVTNLTLPAQGTLQVQVVYARNSTAFAGAAGTITGTDLGSVAPVSFRTGADGRFAVAVPGGNYTVQAGAPGFVNSTESVYVPWITGASVTLALAPPYGANVSVQLVSAVDGLSLAGGHVAVSGGRNLTAGPGGWANFTDLGPPGLFVFVGWAPGFQARAISAPLTSGLVVPHLVLALRPVPPCPPAGGGPGCPAPAPNGTAAFAGLLPGPGAALLLVCAVPAVIAGLAAAGLLSGRLRAGRAAVAGGRR